MPREQAEYWRETLADAPELLEVPADSPRPAQPAHARANVPLKLDEEVTAGPMALGSRHGATFPTTLLAGWAAVVGRLPGRTDRVIGCFVNPCGAGGPVRPVFERVVELVQPDGAHASATPLFRAAFAWRDAPVRAELPGLEARPTAGLDLSLELREEVLRGPGRRPSPWQRESSRRPHQRRSAAAHVRV